MLDTIGTVQYPSLSAFVQSDIGQLEERKVGLCVKAQLQKPEPEPQSLSQPNESQTSKICSTFT